MISLLFIKRPRLAAVISIIITILGLIALYNIPVAQYPQITPPEIRVTAFYPGADAQVVADSVAAPIEEEINGVDKMLYMSSTCANDGTYSLGVTFAVGTDPDIDQVNLQNRLQLAMPKLPKEVVEQGIDIRKRSSSIMAAISFYSPNKTWNMLYLSNYVSRNIRDALVRLRGVSDILIFGEKEYSMRVWLDPDRLTSLGLIPEDVITAIRQQNIQAAVGSIGAEPVKEAQQLKYTLRAKGRLKDVKDFEDIIVRTNDKGGLVTIRDIGRVELGAKTYSHQSTLNGVPAVTIALYRTPGANAINTMDEVREKLKLLADRMPKDIKYKIILDTTKYVSAAVHEIERTLFITFLLVVAIVYLFLQDWRATLIPTLAVPVSLIGTFSVLLVLGYSANTVSLFALILAIGLVVDDAIVVVENVYRVMEEEGLPRDRAAVKAMGQVTGPIIATTLVLLAVFVPVGFMPGITGELYKQFAVTICTSVVISTICALTLSPALCATILKMPDPIRHGPLAWFNKGLNITRRAYISCSAWLIRKIIIAFLLFVVIIGGSYLLFSRLPTSFLPLEDQGYFFFNCQLPEAASLARTSGVIANISEEIRKIQGVSNVIGVSGFSFLSGNADNVGFGVVILDPWNRRKVPGLRLSSIIGKSQAIMSSISSANMFAFPPPAILGLGTTGGFDFRLQATGDQDPHKLASVMRAMVIAANMDPVLSKVFCTYRANTPHIYVKLDRAKAETLRVPVSRIYSILQAYLGSLYVNDFNLYGRVYHVKVQAEGSYRDDYEDIKRIYVRSCNGDMVPMRSIATMTTMLAPQLVYRYNQFASVQINGQAAPGHSSGEAMAAMEGIAAKVLPEGYTYDWSSMSFQEKKMGGQVLILFMMAMIFGYLFLVGQYESWSMPVPIILYVPVASLGALIGLWVSGLSLSIYAQIGLVLLVGLASKNAILIVEFARDCREQEGLSVMDAALNGIRIRFRPVLMTAFTFIMGVAPMLTATGAGAYSRRHIGTTVFSGMMMATIMGILLIPVLFYAFQSLREHIKAWRIRRK